MDPDDVKHICRKCRENKMNEDHMCSGCNKDEADCVCEKKSRPDLIEPTGFFTFRKSQQTSVREDLTKPRALVSGNIQHVTE